MQALMWIGIGLFMILTFCSYDLYLWLGGSNRANRKIARFFIIHSSVLEKLEGLIVVSVFQGTPVSIVGYIDQLIESYRENKLNIKSFIGWTILFTVPLTGCYIIILCILCFVSPTIVLISWFVFIAGVFNEHIWSFVRNKPAKIVQYLNYLIIDEER